jgi:serine kinase of HPr protein (carbohydrate metabolism regulator)
MSETQQTIVHATSVALDPVAGGGSDLAGILLRGAAGRGKSDLALRLIDGGAILVADDRTVLRRRGNDILLGPRDPIRGRLEVRGLGIVPVEHVADVPLLLIIDLVDAGAVERLPPPRSETVLGLAVPAIALAPFESSAPAKVRLAVRAAACGILHRLD